MNRNLKDIIETGPKTKEEYLLKLKFDLECLMTLGTSGYSKTKAQEVLFELQSAEKKKLI